MGGNGHEGLPSGGIEDLTSVDSIAQLRVFNSFSEVSLLSFLLLPVVEILHSLQLLAPVAKRS